MIALPKSSFLLLPFAVARSLAFQLARERYLIVIDALDRAVEAMKLHIASMPTEANLVTFARNQTKCGKRISQGIELPA